MIRLHFVVEGQTEEKFVNAILREHLAVRGVFADVRCVETSRSAEKIYRGGVRTYQKIRNDIVRWMNQERKNADAHFTTMIDLYRLPHDFPGREPARQKQDPYERVQVLERAFAEDLNDRRFVPYLQLHEFEAVLLSNPAEFEAFYTDARFQKAIESLCTLVSGFESPELINDGEITAPSKRIASEIPTYTKEKAAAAPIIAQRISLDVIRAKCKHFRVWLTRIEALAGMTNQGGSE